MTGYLLISAIYIVACALIIWKSHESYMEVLKDNSKLRREITRCHHELAAMHENSYELIQNLLKSQLAREIMEQIRNGEHDDGNAMEEETKPESEVRKGTNGETQG